jgi:hypothetical protein
VTCNTALGVLAGEPAPQGQVFFMGLVLGCSCLGHVLGKAMPQGCQRNPAL